MPAFDKQTRHFNKPLQLLFVLAFCGKIKNSALFHHFQEVVCSCLRRQPSRM